MAVVSGGNRGIGKEVCVQLAYLGYKVILTARDLEVAKHEASRLHNNIVPATLDIRDDSSVEQLVYFIMNKFGRIDVLVNNAGVFLDNENNGAFSSILEMELDILKETMEVNLYGTLRLTKEIFKCMQVLEYGRIVNVSSGMGRLSSLTSSNDIRRDARTGPFYRISKASLNALTRIFAVEGKQSNIKVNAVCPGWVKTDMGSSKAIRTVTEGAYGIVWAATLDDNGPTGGFFRDCKQLNW
ncbi:SDR family NAD(P)-dependent oxidoreductase [Oceanobacillus sp. CFH 90083]|uniref:SDR family NAD(P)-dependent oxidoreductase n=1 Tax=Oceanobacillus sp. CFH 90083 TaxID=2592336 RepID=UPI001D14CBFB|nr:SDR family NAD(P)-dependent oxidoreductase [Oceanobacillus sp. CFH 90083]